MSSYVSRSKGMLEETDKIGEEKTLTTVQEATRDYFLIICLFGEVRHLEQW